MNKQWLIDFWNAYEECDKRGTLTRQAELTFIGC